MAGFRLVGNGQYIGNAGDTRPVYPEAGALCYEVDTGKWFVSYDRLSWTQYFGALPLNPEVRDKRGERFYSAIPARS